MTSRDSSAVVITRNQAWNVERLLASVLREPAIREVVVVDSASTDDTIESALRFPVRVIRLRPEQRLSAAAGRHVGLMHTTGALVLFLDGDTELHPGWLERAIGVLASRSAVAGITGTQHQLPIGATHREEEPVSKGEDGLIETVRQTGGCVLLRRSVLEEVGSFNPFLFSDEEPELAIRIRRAGYLLVRTGYPMLWEYTDPKNDWRTVVARWRQRLYVGAGQNLRLHLGKPTFGMYVRERGFGLVPLAVVAVAAAVSVWAVWTKNWWAIPSLGGLAVIGFLVESMRRRSFLSALTSVVRRAAIAEGTIRGFFVKTPESDDYDPLFDIIR